MFKGIDEYLEEFEAEDIASDPDNEESTTETEVNAALEKYRPTGKYTK